MNSRALRATACLVTEGNVAREVVEAAYAWAKLETAMEEAAWLIDNAPPPTLGGIMHATLMEWVERRDAGLKSLANGA